MEYILCLYRQFCEAKGLDPNKTDLLRSPVFAEWIAENKVQLNSYLIYLHEIGFDYYIDETIEVGKGKFDTISGYDIQTVSPYAETFGMKNSSLFVQNGKPIIITSDKKIITPNNKIILTHNPYKESDIHNWHLIHNDGSNNISIGMFGKLTDENAARKIIVLESLCEQMDEDYEFSYDTDKNNYFSTINSKRKIKEKIHVR